MISFILTVMIVCTIIFSYPLLRLSYWFFSINFYQAIGVIIIAMALSFSVILCRVISDATIALFLMKTSNYLLGIFIYLFIFIFISEVIQLIAPNLISKQKAAILSIIAALSVSLVAILLFHTQFRLVIHDLPSDKITKPYHFLHLTDTQFGTLNRGEIEKIATKVNQALAEYPIDAILFTGDLIDTNHFSYEDLKSLDFKGVDKYFSLGNHEFYHGYQKTINLINQLNYTILKDSNQQIDQVNLIGVDDPARNNEPRNWLNQHLTEDLIIPDSYNILLYHRPTEVRFAKQMGVDLMLSGHTHGGQFFPFTFILKFLYEFPKGLVKLDDFYLYTSDGAGLWGPKMRLGSTNEIAIINLIPSNN